MNPTWWIHEKKFSVFKLSCGIIVFVISKCCCDPFWSITSAILWYLSIFYWWKAEKRTHWSMDNGQDIRSSAAHPLIYRWFFSFAHFIQSHTIHSNVCVSFFFFYCFSLNAGLVFAPAIGDAGAGGQHNFSNPFLQNAYIA